MVNQVETETADNGENGGAGRIPAGFSTMTCAVYKWEQLHTTILKSYPPGSASDVDCASNPHTQEYYTRWRSLPEGSIAREEAMKKVSYELSLQNSGVVAWCCTLKLEMAVHLAKEIFTNNVAIGRRARQTGGNDLPRKRVAGEAWTACVCF